jgi:hypothetical protein
MSDSSKNNTIHYTSYIALAFVSLLLLLFIFFWVSLEKDIRSLKYDNGKELNQIEKIRTNLLIDLKTKLAGDSTIVIQIDDIEKINERYDDLYLYVRENTNRAESLINKDLDRLSLYMAIGIGFVGILGIFVPILVNIMSVQDLRDKLKDAGTKEEINKVSKKAEEAIEKTAKIEGVLQSIEKLNNGYNKTVPAVTTLIIQAAIGRFFNITPTMMTQLARGNQRDYFIEILDTIKVAFQSWDNNDAHNIIDDQVLQSTIRDFSLYIGNLRFQTSSFSKEVFIKFQDLNVSLEKLINSSAENESMANKSVQKAIDNINEALKND